MRNRNTRRGSILTECLLALGITCFLLPVDYSLFKVLLTYKPDYTELQNEIGIAQLRRIMNVCYDMEMNGNGMSCTYNNEMISVKSNDRFVYITEGTWIFLTGLKDVRFDNDGTYLYMEYTYRDKEERVLLAYAQ